VPDKGVSKLGAIDRSVDVAQQVRETANVVFMGVGEEDSPDLFFVLNQISEVGYDDVDAIHFFIGERKSAVDDDNVISLLDDTAILSNLSNST
jgi:hypothetical protein